MEIDPATAAALGFPKLKYAWVERERRWLCREIPLARVTQVDAITDLYVAGTRLRLREAIPLDGGPPMRRLTRKADVDAATRLLTSIYLAPEEFALLADLPGQRIRKTRHRLAAEGGVTVSVDRFEGPLEGLILAEAEFETAEALAEFWHKRMREELGIAGQDAQKLSRLFHQEYQGSRYSFGYPACPRLEDQEKLFTLLDPGRIDVTLTEEFQLEPEQSTSAIIVHHPEAKYFSIE